MINYSKNERSSLNCSITIKHELEPASVFNVKFMGFMNWVKDMIDFYNLTNLEATLRKFVQYSLPALYKQTSENPDATTITVCVTNVEANYHLLLKNAFMEIEKRTDDEGAKSYLWVLIPQLIN
jgi:hypothetical protein